MSELEPLGALAFFDSMRGLVPVKITNVYPDERKFKVIVTAKSGAYDKGYVMTTPCYHIVPRKSIYYTKVGLARIAAHKWKGIS